MTPSPGWLAALVLGGVVVKWAWLVVAWLGLLAAGVAWRVWVTRGRDC